MHPRFGCNTVETKCLGRTPVFMRNAQQAGSWPVYAGALAFNWLHCCHAPRAGAKQDILLCTIPATEPAGCSFAVVRAFWMPCMTVMGDASPTFWPALLPPQAVRACATSWCFERSFPMRRLPPSGPNTTMYIDTKPVTVLPQCPLRLLARLVHLHMERARRGFGAPAWQAQARAPELVLNQR